MLELSTLIMSDDRLLLHQTEFLDMLTADEIACAHSLPVPVWQRLQLVVDSEERHG